MAEYINRTSIYDVLTMENPFGWNNNDLAELFRQAKAADVAPVRHGRWEDKPNPQWKAYDIRYCSVCGWSIHKSKLRNADLNWRYCPNCGAKMDGDM